MKHLTLSFTLLALAACGGGGGGGGALLLSPTQQANSATSSSASLASSQSQAANTSISAAVSNLSELVSSNPTLTSNAAVTSAAVAAQNAVVLAAAAQSAASTAAADLVVASNVVIVGVVNDAGRTICVAAASCTKAEISGLGFKAAETAKNAAEASLYAITATNQLKTLISSVAPSVNVSTATAAIASAESSATSAQATANLTISNLSTAAREMGITITTISPSSGSTGSVAGTPSYSGNTQTIVTTFGNGQTSTATNTATGSADTWATDNVTKTTTYTYANGGTNAVVATVPAVASTPALTAAVYPSDWTTTGTVLNPSVNSITNTFGNGVVTTIESGTSLLPFNQSSLSAQSITDPSAVVRSSTTDYNLIWGTPDKNGPAYATAFNQGNSSFTYLAPLTIMGNSVQGLFVGSGPTYAAPHLDVVSAWNQGWTGKGVNVVIADAFNAPETHGVIVTSLVARYAIGASYFGIPLDIYKQSSTNVFAIDGTRANLQTTINIGVINTSFGVNYSNGTSDAARTLMDNTSSVATLRTDWTNILKGSVGFVYQGINLTDAVITKAAGNDAITSEKESFVKAYADDSSIRERLLVVGALDFDSNGKGIIASYSNTAGADANVKSRFVTASGGTPFITGDIYLNGTVVNGSDYGNLGTSFAAPRVAGYAAILRQKFPNLNAAKTSSIILDTARYDTLSCNPNCDPNIYGAGQASLSRALAPVGRLR